MTAVALILNVTAGRQTRLVVVTCPYCHQRHTHGWPHGHATVGHRLAHCGRGNYLVGQVDAS